MAMVMPQTFVASEAGPNTRKMLLEECDVLEIWELPGDIFRDATVQPMVVFAQRKRQNDNGQISVHPVRVRTAQRRAAKLYQEEGIFTASSLGISQTQWGPDSQRGPRTTHVMDYQFTLLPSLWEKIRYQTLRLDEVADITQGAIVGSSERWRWANYESPKRVKWLTSAKQSLPCPFFIVYGDETVLYPNELEKPRKDKRRSDLDKEHLLSDDKVLLVSDPNASWGQRAIVAIERKGYYPSHSFWVLVPKEQQPDYISLEVVAAIVSWYVSNAWVVEHLKATFIPSLAIQSIPFPKLHVATCMELTKAVQRLEVAAQNAEQDFEAQQIIDHILKAAYGLDDATFERLRMIAQWDEFDVEQLRKQPPNPAELLDVTGGVESVNAQEGLITLWLNGFPGFQTVPIADAMPGWMLRPGAAFKARIPQDNFRQQSLEGVKWFNIVPQEYTYLSEDELIDELDRTFAGVMSH